MAVVGPVHVEYNDCTDQTATMNRSTPPCIVWGAGKRALKRVTPILGGFSRDDYVTERLWAKAEDGTEVGGQTLLAPLTSLYYKHRMWPALHMIIYVWW